MAQSGIAGIETAGIVAGWRESPDTATGDYWERDKLTKDTMTGHKPQKSS